MTESQNTGGLSRQAREFVGVGASVGAGCHPCLTHHVKAGTEAGLDAGALLAAIAAAERVGADASARMTQHARRQLPTPASGSGTGGGTVRDAALAALGAAIAANSMPNIERYLTEAAELGVSRDELAEAVHLAQEVQGNAARIHARLTARLLDAPLPATQAPAAQGSAAEEQAGECDQTCPCHDEEGTSGAGAGPEVLAPATVGGAPSATGACGDVDAGNDKPSPETVSRQPSAAIGSWGGAAAGIAACAPPPAMLAACCGRGPA